MIHRDSSNLAFLQAERGESLGDGLEFPVADRVLSVFFIRDAPINDYERNLRARQPIITVRGGEVETLTDGAVVTAVNLVLLVVLLQSRLVAVGESEGLKVFGLVAVVPYLPQLRPQLLLVKCLLSDAVFSASSKAMTKTGRCSAETRTLIGGERQ